MAETGLGTPAQRRDPDYLPPLTRAVPLGIQHVLAMFVSNVTPVIIVCGAAGIGPGSDQAAAGYPDMTYMIQMAMLMAGVATLFQTVGLGPVGARLPIVQGTSFAFVPVMIPAVAGLGAAGMAGLMTGIFLGGLFHFCLGFVVGRLRRALPPLVTGTIVLMIGLSLLRVGIQYAAGGTALAGTPAYGTLAMWWPALAVIAVTLGVTFFGRGWLPAAAVLIGLIAGYAVALALGQVSFDALSRAPAFAAPQPFRWGFAFDPAIVLGLCAMAVVSAIETVGDTSGITRGGAGREATDRELAGATFADGLGTAVAGVFGGLPNTSFSQNVGLIAITGVMSRHVVTIGALFLIVCGLLPKAGALIGTVPINVLGGGVVVMFGMVCASGISMLSTVRWSRRNMAILALALSVGFGLQLEPGALQNLGRTAQILLTTGLLPAAAIAITLNLILPDTAADTAADGADNAGNGRDA